MEDRIASKTICKLFNISEALQTSEFSTQEEIEYFQLEFLASNTNNRIVEDLIAKYNLCPSLVLQTILMIHDDPEISNIPAFPYSALINALNAAKFENVNLIESLCDARPSIFINMLYRFSLSISSIEANNSIRGIELLVGFKHCFKIFEEKALWGLERPRIGVNTVLDKLLCELLQMGLEVNITQMNLILNCIRNGNKHDEVCFESDQKTINDFSRIKNVLMMKLLTFDLSKDYSLPFFLEHPFNSVRGFEPDFKINKEYVVHISSFEQTIYEIILKLVHKASIKDHFCALIENVYAQDRKKLKFVPEENATDSFCYVLFSVLLKISKGIFEQELFFISKIDEKKFPTFSFFHLARLMEICHQRLISDIQEEYNVENSSILIRRNYEIIQKYFNFVYDLIDSRKDEVFSVLLPESENKNNHHGNSQESSLTVKRTTDLLRTEKAKKVGEILYDTDFLNAILVIQPALDCRHIPNSIITLIRELFSYKNVLKSPAIKVLSSMGSRLQDEQLINGLVSYYSTKDQDVIMQDRYLLHDILKDVKVGISNDSLRMMSTCLASFEENISKIFDSIKNINNYKKKGKELSCMLEENAFSDNISDDEEVIKLYPDHILKTLSTMSDQELAAFIRSKVGGDSEQVLKEIKSQIKYMNDPLKTKIYKKIKVNEQRLANSEKQLKNLSIFLEKLLIFLKSFICINKKLFLNRNIFFRTNSILNSALNLLVGEDSKNIKIEKKSEYHFNPKEILRHVCLIVVNLLKQNEKLVKNSGINKNLLKKAIDLCSSKYLLMEDQISSLAEIHNILEMQQDVYKESEATSANEELEIPDEFLDPLTCLMMENPVVLLTSKVTIDLNTFKQIMLNDQIDPFSRQPLDETKYVENKELKERIKEFMKNKSV